MIIKSSQRGYGQLLANHLTNTRENEIAELTNYRFVSAQGKNPVHQALAVMELMASQAPLCKKPFYHISVNPDQNLSPQQWQKTWEIYELEYGLVDQAFVEVTHRKGGRTHKHRVYDRVTQGGKTLKLSFTYLRNEKISRILEYYFHHPLTIGKHNQAVIKQLKKEKLEPIATWMEAGKAHSQPRAVAKTNPSEDQQQKRTKIAIEQVKCDLQQAYQRTNNGWEFIWEIARQGYILARGDRRDYVVVDPTGNVHSPRKRINVKAKELKEKWADLTPSKLLTVAEAKVEQKQNHWCEMEKAISYLEAEKAKPKSTQGNSHQNLTPWKPNYTHLVLNWPNSDSSSSVSVDLAPQSLPETPPGKTILPSSQQTNSSDMSSDKEIDVPQEGTEKSDSKISEEKDLEQLIHLGLVDFER